MTLPVAHGHEATGAAFRQGDIGTHGNDAARCLPEVIDGGGEPLNDDEGHGVVTRRTPTPVHTGRPARSA